MALPTDLRARVRAFVEEDLLPLEPMVLRNEMAFVDKPFPAEPGVTYLSDPLGVIPPDVYASLLGKAKQRGLWGLDVPEEFGGQDVSMTEKMAAIEEMGRTIVPFFLPPDSPNLHWLKETVTPGQRERYLEPYARGEITSGIALTEDAAGSDVAGIQTTARRSGDSWILTGRKKWIGWADTANFLIVVAVTDKEKGVRGGMTAFLVDRHTPGVVVERRLPTITWVRPCEVRFDEVRLGPEQVLGAVGHAFAPLQNRLSVRRLEIAARSIGSAARLLELMIERAKHRVTFGEPLASRQTIQNWIADSAMALHALKLVTADAVRRIDDGQQDVRIEAGMAKLMGSETLSRIADRAVQLFGAMGVGKDLPIEHYLRNARVMTIAEGSSEVQRMVIARSIIRDGLRL